MIILGIETSCDETSAAIVTDDGEILSNIVLSQIDEHTPYGGVVPEIAARAHLDYLDGLVVRALDKAGLGFSDLDAVAATAGPGLIGGVMVGVMTAKAIAAVHDLPFIAVNHLEGHALTARLTDQLDYPYLLLLVSGGHTQLLSVNGVGDYTRLGTTIDDAVGEAFDKVAKMLGLGYPGGPKVEQAAQKCADPARAAKRFALPRPMKGRKGCDFSLSGLKTAVRRKIESLTQDKPNGPDAHDIADLCAAFQIAVGDILSDRCGHAIEIFRERKRAITPPDSCTDSGTGTSTGTDAPKDTLVVAGGVAANRHIRKTLNDLTRGVGMAFICPPVSLCSDNAAMIAWAGAERLKLGLTDTMDFAARPRWPLDPDAPPATGAGIKA